jgi:hypothetical protein
MSTTSHRDIHVAKNIGKLTEDMNFRRPIISQAIRHTDSGNVNLENTYEEIDEPRESIERNPNLHPFQKKMFGGKDSKEGRGIFRSFNKNKFNFCTAQTIPEQ